jgi:ribosomal protein L6P/L9E
MFKGRGYKINEAHSELLTFKVGYSHNLKVIKNKKIKIQNLSKNLQKFEMISELPYILQFFSCFRFIKNSNKFTNKGLFFENENFILKKSTKAS